MANGRGRKILAWAVILIQLSVSRAPAQSITTSNTGFGSTRRQGDSAAEAISRTDWPLIHQGENGTQVHVTFDPRNVDAVLMTGREFGLRPLLAEAQQLAGKMKLPQADFITFLGTKTVTVDVELNDYLVHPARGRTEATIDMFALMTALRASSLPRPIVVVIQPESADLARLTSPGKERRFKGPVFLGLDEVKPGTVLRLETSIPWYAPIIAAGFGVTVLGGLLFSVFMPWQLARLRREQARKVAAGISVESSDPEEVQNKYNKQPALWKGVILFPILLLSTALFGDPKRVMESGLYALPEFVTDHLLTFLPVILVGSVGLSSVACLVVERIRAKREGLPSIPRDPDEPPAWTQKWWLLLLGIMMLFMMGIYVLAFGGFPRPPWLRYLPFLPLWGVLIGGPIGGWLAYRAVRTPLPPGDPWREMTQEVAARAGVTVKHVVKIQSTSVNAYASAFGTVGLTSALLRKMAPDEIRAVIAHEVGHLRGGHARRNLVLTLTGTVVVLGLWWGLVSTLEGRVSKFGAAILRSPLFSIFLLPILMNLILGKGRRQREQAADRFAVEVTGDPELVIRMLTRLHNLESTPHELKPSDEAISTHPSLANRIAAIREFAAARTAGYLGVEGLNDGAVG